MTHPLPHPRPLDAAQALDALLDLIVRDIEGWLALFADDATVEFPYATALGVPGRFEGKEAIRRYFQGTIERFRDLSLRDVRRYPTTDPDVALAEVHGSAIILPSGKRYEQDYVMVVATRDGKVVRYREYWNPAPVAEAFGELAAPREGAS
ncbi:nuclear transport factor 2 family protein [Sorangium sp. So ce296]|uniref:nuclear transport factor 2 family protein n=1 Tax=Sorangium sp. So ce296 TaxID=3133296 RepID=UPI00077934CA|nr:phenazine biosynthesis protein [Sorangium cellulosum]